MPKDFLNGKRCSTKKISMPRSVNSVAAKARKKKVYKAVKGQYGRRKNVWTIAKNAYEKGQQYAYRDRKKKKADFRKLWIARINAGVRAYDLTYSQFMGMVHQKNIQLNRKVLADLAMNHPDAFKAVVETVKK
jgi:large subunit ribosomal protein L20